MTLGLAALWVTVMAVMDGSRLSLAGRVVLAVAVLLALSWGGSSPQAETTGAPPAQLAVQATPQLPHGSLDGHLPLVGMAARQSQRNRRGSTLVAVLAAALAGIVVAATRRLWVARTRHLDRRLFALGPRAPPFRS